MLFDVVVWFHDPMKLETLGWSGRSVQVQVQVETLYWSDLDPGPKQ